MFSVATEKRLYERAFAYTWWADDADDNGWCFFGEAVDQGDVEALFFDLYVSVDLKIVEPVVVLQWNALLACAASLVSNMQRLLGSVLQNAVSSPWSSDVDGSLGPPCSRLRVSTISLGEC